MNGTCRKTVRAVGLAAALTVTPSVSWAIDFNWSFVDSFTGETIEGMVLGLTDNVFDQAASDVMLTDDGGSLTFILPQSTIGGAIINEWDVVAGQITFVDYLSVDFDVTGDSLSFLGSPNNIAARLNDGFIEDPRPFREGNVIFTAKSSVVPEPTTLLLMGLGLAGLGFAKKRRH